METFPFIDKSDFNKGISRVLLRLNSVTNAYAALWEEITGEPGTSEVPFRNAVGRREALNEIDALVTLALGITADELCTIYRTQFPVMRKYDTEGRYDTNGRLVSKKILNEEKKAKTPESL